MRKVYKEYSYQRGMEMVKIPKAEYELLKKQSDIDVDLLNQLIESLKDIREGRIRRVK